MTVKTWIAGTNGLWSNGVNWTPTGFPQAADDVVLQGPASRYQTVSGNGNSASTTAVGQTMLSGFFGTGALSVGNASSQGALIVASGTLTATSATVLFGPLQVTGAGTKLTVSGALTLGGFRASNSLLANSVVVGTGAAVQAASVALVASPGGNGITVDSASSFRVGTTGTGTTGTGTAGKISVDAGRTITGAGSLIATTGVLNLGTITAQGGTLSIGGGVSGAGLLQIGAGATLYVFNGVSSQNVAFVGAGGVLEIGLTGPTGLSETGVVAGFVPGESILFASSAALSSATYVAGAGGLGTLTLNSGGAALGTLTLSGNYAGYLFQVTPSPTYGSVITVVQASSNVPPGGGGGGGGTGTGSPGTGTGSPGTDAFGWSASSGAWSNAANWRDTTNAGNVAVPGAANAVTLNGPSAANQTITGPGASASLAILGNNTLSGAFTTGQLSVGSASAPGALTLAPGTTLAARSATLLFGPLQESGAGTRLSVTDLLTLGGERTNRAFFPANTLNLTTGAAVQAGGLVLAPSLGGNGISVDSASSLEVGTAGGAAAGMITIDAGRTLIGAGTLTASAGVLNQGTISAQGGALEIGSAVSGGGQLAIGAGATLYLSNGVTSQPVSFAGAGGTLELTLTGAGELTGSGLVSGFAAGDTIYVASGAPITGVSYRPGDNGLGALALANGGATLGTLNLAGTFTGYHFQVGAHAGYGFDVSLAYNFQANPDPLFDVAYYLAANPDVAAAGVDPYQHFSTTGWREGRDPSALFHVAYYLNQNPDVAAAGINPLQHFENFGWREGRDPSLGFSVRGYLAANADVKAVGLDPLWHYAAFGKAEGRAALAATPHAVGTPDPAVDYAYYYAQHPEVAVSGADASASFHAAGAKLGYNPNAYFDTNFYLAQNPDVKAAGIDPLLHYEGSGWREGRAPSLAFSGADYLAANPDVRAAGLNPLLHYMASGKAEGRIGFVAGGGTVPDPLLDTVFYDAQLGASLFPTGAAGLAQATASYNATGWQHGLNPDALFDTKYYLLHNPDVAAAGINPLQHYEQNGWREGRDPSADFSTGKYLAAYADVRNGGLNPLAHYFADGQAEGRSAFHV